MDTDSNWYRQLLALVLLSASKAAVEFITNPGSREDAGNQVRDAFKQIDYEAVAKAVTHVIDDLAESSKGRLSETIDTLRDSGVEAVEAAQERAEKQLGQPKKKRRKLRFLFGLVVGGLIAYFIFDEQRRDDLLDKLTGASGPIQPPASSWTTQVQNTAQQAGSAAQQAADAAADAASQATEKAGDQTSEK
jgi:hypothetical protein